MSDGLTPGPTSSTSPTTRSAWVVAPLQAVAVLALFVGAGLAGGRLWVHLWDVPSGVVSGGQWYTDEAGLRDDFQGVALFVTIAGLTGLVLGLLCAWLLARSELLTLVAVLAGSVLAAYVMLKVGAHYTGPDPHEVAKTAADGTKLKGSLRVTSWPPRGAGTFGALVGLAFVYAISLGKGPDQPTWTPPPSWPPPPQWTPEGHPEVGTRR